jgi:hypothetical protein
MRGHNQPSFLRPPAEKQPHAYRDVVKAKKAKNKKRKLGSKAKAERTFSQLFSSLNSVGQKTLSSASDDPLRTVDRFIISGILVQTFLIFWLQDVEIF